MTKVFAHGYCADLGDGVRLSEATAADFAILNLNMREEDRKEVEVFGRAEEDPDLWEAAYAAWHGEHLFGIVGFGCTSPLSAERYFIFMSTTHVEEMKYLFVKKTRAIANWVMRQMPRYVTRVVAMPMSSYTRSIKWQERCLGFRKEKEVLVNGVKHTILTRERSQE